MTYSLENDDMIGRQFGRLTVKKRVPPPEHIKYRNRIYYECECSCEKHTVKIVYRNHLLNGSIVSCGCYCKEQTAKANKEKKRKYNKYDLDTNEYGIGYDDKGNSFLFDKEDYEKIRYLWWRQLRDGYFGATYYDDNGKQKEMYLHKYIMNDYVNIYDHINGSPNDDRKSNLRISTVQQNSMNHKIHSNNTSGVSGVHYSRRANKWVARIGYKMKRISLGYYDNYEDAVNARIKAEKELFGEWSRDFKDKKEVL